MHKDILDLYKWAGVEMEAPRFPESEDAGGSTISFLGVPDFKFSAREFPLGDTTGQGWVRER